MQVMIQSTERHEENYWTIALLARSSRGKRSKVLSTLIGKSNYSNDSSQEGSSIDFAMNSLLGDRRAFPFKHLTRKYHLRGTRIFIHGLYGTRSLIFSQKESKVFPHPKCHCNSSLKFLISYAPEREINVQRRYPAHIDGSAPRRVWRCKEK